MGTGRVKVVGYAQRVFYDGGIEYRNFSDSLVGQQFTEGGGDALFTIGNFTITENVDPRISKLFNTRMFSSFYSLNDLNVTTNQSISILPSTTELKLNLDKTKLTNYAFFGSFREFIRVALEETLTEWPASLYVYRYYQGYTGNTVQDYAYDTLNNFSTFKIPINNIVNKFDINYTNSGFITPLHTDLFDLRNFTENYIDYSVSGETLECEILSYSGLSDYYVYLKVNGNPFPSAISTGTYGDNYHILPNKLKREEFFNSLDDFKSQLLNRLVIPQYTITFSFKSKSDTGVVLSQIKTATWPTQDGYNLDYDTTYYLDYVETLLDIADGSDAVETNLVSRFFVSESITTFDTVSIDNGSNETSTTGNDDQKIAKTLKIYGREFDEIKRFTDGLSFAHSFSYDKKDNAPDGIIKLVANTLGWELAQSIVDNDILASYLTANTSTYSGQTVGLTPIESEMEFWRRLIINSPWIWKSKGTRKTIEFLFKIIGTPNGLITFNEYVYNAEKPINIDLFLRILNAEGLTNFDLDGTYVFKMTWEESVEYHYIPIVGLNINSFLSTAALSGVNLTVSTFSSNLYEYNPSSMTQVLKFRDLMTTNNILPEDATILNQMWLDQFGYPKTLRNTSSMYFQKGGLWYRETGGANAIVDILHGNNPHVGPYDRGYAYISNFTNLIPDFTATTILNEIITTGTTNIFVNYNSGTFNDLADPTNTPIYTEVVDGNNNTSTCITVSTSIIDSPFAVDKLTECGCVLATSDDALKIDFKCSPNTIAEPQVINCEDLKDHITVDANGILHFNINGNDITSITSLAQVTGVNGAECCRIHGGVVVSLETGNVCQITIPPSGPCGKLTYTYDFIHNFYIFNPDTINETYNMDNIPLECCIALGGSVFTTTDPYDNQLKVNVCGNVKITHNPRNAAII
jgi:hypothetical protein